MCYEAYGHHQDTCCHHHGEGGHQRQHDACCQHEQSPGCGREHHAKRHFWTKEEQIARLEAYLHDLQTEAQAVQEHIEALKA